VAIAATAKLIGQCSYGSSGSNKTTLKIHRQLTVASVAGIPPVLIAGIYGMNFKNMPELNWAWGYPFALVLIVLTTLLPLIWFKWKDWI
jgi:Mg2+ and Co2+ transporter CorA